MEAQEVVEVVMNEESVVENEVVDFQDPVEVSGGNVNKLNDEGTSLGTKSDLVNVFPSGNPRVSTLLNFGFTNPNPTLPNMGCDKKRKKSRDVKSYEQSNLDSYLSTDVKRRKFVKGKRKLT